MSSGAWIPLVMRRMAAVNPRLAAWVGARMFWHLGSPAAVRDADREVHASASVEHLLTRNARVKVYTWGQGSTVVLLVHGWRSRASRLGRLITGLLEAGHTIVSFDAPGHGESGKGASNVLEWADVIRELEAQHGPFHAVVGHSFGVLAAFHAVRIGVVPERMVTIAGPHSLEHIVASFTRQLDLTRRATQHFRQRVDRQVFESSPFEWRQIVSRIDSAGVTLPLLVVHDSSDAVMDSGQAELIADTHGASASALLTEGLGHNRILDDPRVLEAITGFLTTGAGARIPGPTLAASEAPDLLKAESPK